MDASPTFLCATDFSDTAEHALAWTGALARRFGAAVELVHVLPPPVTSVQALATDAAILDTAVFTAAEEHLRAHAAEAQRGLGVPVRGRVLQGDAHRAIAAAAREAHAALIVMGSHGHSPAGRWLFGSTAERVLRVAPCPVAVIPPPGANRADVVGRIADRARPLRVLAGVATGAGSDAIVALARDLAARQPCEVTLLNLYWPPEEYHRLGLQGPRDLFQSDPDVVRDLEAHLRDRLGPLSPGLRLAVRPAWGDPAASLLVAASEADADLLVVATDQRHGLARLTRPPLAGRLAARPGPIPVICVPAARADAEARATAPLPRLATVLAPTDLSPVGNRAVRHAYGLLRGQGGVVELCFVHERALPVPPYVYDDPHGRLEPERRAALEAELRALIPPEAEKLGIATHVTIVDGGQAATAIVQAAERLDVDAISLASHGRGGAARALLGSVADEVVRHARKPVLVVREP